LTHTQTDTRYTKTISFGAQGSKSVEMWRSIILPSQFFLMYTMDMRQYERTATVFEEGQHKGRGRKYAGR
jgi:hypothetical protein